MFQVQFLKTIKRNDVLIYDYYFRNLHYLKSFSIQKK